MFFLLFCFIFILIVPGSGKRAQPILPDRTVRFAGLGWTLFVATLKYTSRRALENTCGESIYNLGVYGRRVRVYPRIPKGIAAFEVRERRVRIRIRRKNFRGHETFQALTHAKTENRN